MQKGSLVIKQEKLATRCEVCHQADMFDPATGHCQRCQDHFPPGYQPVRSVNPVQNSFNSSVFLPILGVITSAYFLYLLFSTWDFSIKYLIFLTFLITFDLAAWWRWYERRWKGKSSENDTFIISFGNAIAAVLSIFDSGFHWQFYMFLVFSVLLFLGPLYGDEFSDLFKRFKKKSPDVE